ncbi:Com family DNA-binding transcriptional regulator [Pseudomonas monteilii]
MQMLKDVRCGNCNRLLARAAGVTQLQIKCSRCGILNHVRVSSPEPSPLSEMRAKSFAKVI